MNVDIGALYSALKALVRLTAKHSPNVLLEARSGTLTLTTTDGPSWLRGEIPCEGDLTACVPAAQLLKTIQPLRRTNTTVCLTGKGDAVEIVCGTVKAALPSNAVETFPSRPAYGELEAYAGQWEVNALADALRFVVRAASTDITRLAMTGVLLEKEHFVATDGHRLHVARLWGLDGAPLLIPASAIGALIGILPKDGMVPAATIGNQLVLRVGAWELITGLIDAPFPPWRHVVPSKSAELFHAVIGRDAIVDAFKHLGKMRKPSGVNLCINGTIKVEQHDDDRVSSTVIDVIGSTHQGPDFEIGVDRRYFVDAVVDADANVIARFFGPLDPVIVEADAHAAVVMPMRL